MISYLVNRRTHVDGSNVPTTTAFVSIQLISLASGELSKSSTVVG